MATKQVRYLKRDDWVRGPEPNPGRAQLLARVVSCDVFATATGEQARLTVDLPDGLVIAHQNPDNMVEVWKPSDLPRVMVKRDEWPAIQPTLALAQ